MTEAGRVQEVQRLAVQMLLGRLLQGFVVPVENQRRTKNKIVLSG